jgi:WD40 repeat protein
MSTRRACPWVILFGLFFAPGRSLSAEEPKLLAQFDPQISIENAIAFSPDGKTVAVGGSVVEENTHERKGAVTLADVATGKVLHTLRAPREVRAVAFSPSGKALISGGDDRLVRFWDAETGRDLSELKGHTEGVNAVAYSPDGKLVASGSWDGTARLWDVTTGEATAVIRNEGIRVRYESGQTSTLAGSPDVHAVAFAPDGKVLAIGGLSFLRLWDLPAQEERDCWNSSTLRTLAFSQDGKFLVTSHVTQIVLWKVKSGKCERVLEPQEPKVIVLGAAYAPDGKTVWAGAEGTESALLSWEVAGGKERPPCLNGIAHRVVAFSPDGRLVAVAGAQTTPRRDTFTVWELPDCSPRK